MRIRKEILLLLLVLLVVGCADVHVQKGHLAMKKYDYESAISNYGYAINSGQLTPKATVNLAEAYRITGDYIRAEQWYRKVVKLREAEPTHKLHLANILKSNGNCDEAKYMYDQYLREFPSDRKVKLLRASCDSMNIFMADSAKLRVKYLSVNNEKSSYSPVYYKDGVVFTSNRNQPYSGKQFAKEKESFVDLFYSRILDAGGELGTPQLLIGDINSDFHEGPATFNANGNKIYFTRSYFKDGQLHANDRNENNLKIFSADLAGLYWINVEELFETEKNYSKAHPSLSADGRNLYFASDIPGGFGGIDIYVVRNEGGKWSEPVNLGPSVNSAGDDMFPTIFQDQKTKEEYLIFSSDGRLGMGGLDIYYSRKQDGKWMDARHISYPVNSTYDDFGMAVDQNQTGGYFSSNREGGGTDKLFSFEVNGEPGFPALNRNPKIVRMTKSIYITETKVSVVEAERSWSGSSSNDPDRSKYVHSPDPTKSNNSEIQRLTEKYNDLVQTIAANEAERESSQLAEERAKAQAEAAAKKAAEEEAIKLLAARIAMVEADVAAKAKAADIVQAEKKKQAEEEAVRQLEAKIEKARMEGETAARKQAEERAALDAEKRKLEESKLAQEKGQTAKAEQERLALEKIRVETELAAKKQTEEKARLELEKKKLDEAKTEQDKVASEMQVKAAALKQEQQRLAEEKARIEAEAVAKKQAEDKARIEAEKKKLEESKAAQEKAAADMQAKANAAKQESERLAIEKARIETEALAKKQAEDKARIEAENKKLEEAKAAQAKTAAELEAKANALKQEQQRMAEEKARIEAEVLARKQQEEKAKQEAERAAKEKARVETEELAKKQAAEKAKEEEERVAKEKQAMQAKSNLSEDLSKNEVFMESFRLAQGSDESTKKDNSDGANGSQGKGTTQNDREIQNKIMLNEADNKQALEAQAKKENEERVKTEAMAQAKKEAAEKARIEAEKKKLEEERIAKEKAAAEAKVKAELIRQGEERAAKEKARIEAEALAKKQAAEAAKIEAEKKRLEAARVAKEKAEAVALAKAEAVKEQERLAKEKARIEAEAIAKKQAAEKAKLDAEKKKQEDERIARDRELKEKTKDVPENLVQNKVFMESFNLAKDSKEGVVVAPEPAVVGNQPARESKQGIAESDKNNPNYDVFLEAFRLAKGEDAVAEPAAVVVTPKPAPTPKAAPAAPPNAGADSSIILCMREANVDLFPLLGKQVTAGGTWTQQSGTTALNGSVFDHVKAGVGTYKFQYDVRGEGAWPSQSAVITVTVATCANSDRK